METEDIKLRCGPSFQSLPRLKLATFGDIQANQRPEEELLACVCQAKTLPRTPSLPQEQQRNNLLPNGLTTKQVAAGV